ncbi:MAG: DNA mismatch repair protein MutS [Luteitalea sp.]|nr:DNA mismatch repair protein MutS [Luteitalea sp.]
MGDDRPDEIVEVPIEGVLDLHAFAPRDVVAVVDDYLAAAREKGLREVRLIHGRGIGAQRAAVHRLLRSLPAIEFWDAPESHLGATIVRFRDPDDVGSR